MNNEMKWIFDIAHDIALADGGIDDLETYSLTDCIRAVGYMMMGPEPDERISMANVDAVAAALYIIAKTTD